MSVITITGRPGYGKTLNMVERAVHNFKNDNPTFKIWWTEKILRKEYVYIVNEYSNFPIRLLKGKKNKIYKIYDSLNDKIYESEEIYSFKVRLFDLRIKYNYNEKARFYIDEIQAMYDSMEYRDFPDCIAHFFQTHRHLEYNNIYTNSQSLSRIIKRVLVISEEYHNIISFKSWWKFAIVDYKITYDLATSKEENIINDKTNEIEYARKIFLKDRIFDSYNTKYLQGLKEKGQNYKNEPWTNLIMSYEDIMYMFFPTNEEKEELKKERY